MAGVFVILPFNHVNGTVADANEVMANNAAMRDGHNNSLHGTTGHNHDGTNWNGPKLGAGAIDLTVDFNWTGIHTYLCSKLRVKGAGAGTVGFCYENTATNRTHTIRAGSADDYFVLEGAIQTLTNKTLTSPIINSPAINTSMDLSAGAVTVALNNVVNALNFDSNTLSIDALNNRIGIGTNAPTDSIHSAGSIRVDGSFRNNSAVGAANLQQQSGIFAVGCGASAGGQFFASQDYNVTSYVRNAAGDYTINFSVANSTNNTATNVTNSNTTIASNKHGAIIIASSTTTVQIGTLDDGGVALDSDYYFSRTGC